VDLHVTLGARGRMSADVYRQLRAAILDGRLRPGEALPATRALARRLDVSRNTVMNAYERLIAEGLSPIRRWGTAQDVGDAVAALVTGAIPFSTGEVINVDGGYHLRKFAT